VLRDGKDRQAEWKPNMARGLRFEGQHASRQTRRYTGVQAGAVTRQDFVWCAAATKAIRQRS
jgi:hypothetical protein